MSQQSPEDVRLLSGAHYLVCYCKNDSCRCMGANLDGINSQVSESPQESEDKRQSPTLLPMAQPKTSNSECPQESGDKRQSLTPLRIADAETSSLKTRNLTPVAEDAFKEGDICYCEYNGEYREVKIIRDNGDKNYVVQPLYPIPFDVREDRLHRNKPVNNMQKGYAFSNDMPYRVHRMSGAQV